MNEYKITDDVTTTALIIDQTNLNPYIGRGYGEIASYEVNEQCIV